MITAAKVKYYALTIDRSLYATSELLLGIVKIALQNSK